MNLNLEDESSSEISTEESGESSSNESSERRTNESGENSTKGFDESGTNKSNKRSAEVSSERNLKNSDESSTEESGERKTKKSTKNSLRESDENNTKDFDRDKDINKEYGDNNNGSLKKKTDTNEENYNSPKTNVDNIANNINETVVNEETSAVRSDKNETSQIKYPTNEDTENQEINVYKKLTKGNQGTKTNNTNKIDGNSDVNEQSSENNTTLLDKKQHKENLEANIMTYLRDKENSSKTSNEDINDNHSELSWKSYEYNEYIHKTKHRAVVFEDELDSFRKLSLDDDDDGDSYRRPKSACSIHQNKEGKSLRLYNLTRGQCRNTKRCNSSLGLRRHDNRIFHRCHNHMHENGDDSEKKYNIVNFRRCLKLLGFSPEEFGLEENSSAHKPKTKNVKPMTITRLERRTVSLDDVRRAVLDEFENDMRVPDHSHRQVLAKAVYEEWYFRKRDEAIKKREQLLKQQKIRQWDRERIKNEKQKKCQETYEEWLIKKRNQEKMEKLKSQLLTNNLSKRQNHQEKSEIAFQTWKKTKESSIQKRLEDKKKEKENQEEVEKERKRIEAEKAYELWKKKIDEDIKRRKQKEEKKLKERRLREHMLIEERHRNAEASFRYWKQKKEQELKEKMKRSRRARELAVESRNRMRENQIYESNQAFMEWLDMIEERFHLQNDFDDKHKCSKHPPWFPAGSKSVI